MAWDVQLDGDWNLTKEAAELERLLQAGKLAVVNLDGALLAQAHPIWQQLVTAAEQGNLQLTVRGTIPDEADLAWGSLAPRHGAALCALLQRLCKEPHRASTPAWCWMAM